MIEKIKEKYIAKIKEKFFSFDNMKAIKEEIESMGFKTSRIYGHKNVKRLTATDDYRNRIEFIYSDKHKFILFSFNSSNTLHKSIVIEANFKHNIYELFNPSDSMVGLNSMIYNNHIVNSEDYYKYEAIDFFIKRSCINMEMAKVSNMGVVNNMAIIRNIIIYTEIDQKKLPNIMEIPLKRRETFIKLISEEIFTFLFNTQYSLGETDLYPLEIRTVLFGYFFYPHILNKFRFDENDLEHIYQTYIIPYISENKEQLFKKLMKKNSLSSIEKSYVEKSYVEKYNERFKSFFILGLLKDVSERDWFKSVNDDLMIENNSNNEVIISSFFEDIIEQDVMLEGY